MFGVLEKLRERRLARALTAGFAAVSPEIAAAQEFAKPLEGIVQPVICERTGLSREADLRCAITDDFLIGVDQKCNDFTYWPAGTYEGNSVPVTTCDYTEIVHEGRTIRTVKKRDVSEQIREVRVEGRRFLLGELQQLERLGDLHMSILSGEDAEICLPMYTTSKIVSGLLGREGEEMVQERLYAFDPVTSLLFAVNEGKHIPLGVAKRESDNIRIDPIYHDEQYLADLRIYMEQIPATPDFSHVCTSLPIVGTHKTMHPGELEPARANRAKIGLQSYDGSNAPEDWDPLKGYDYSLELKLTHEEDLGEGKGRFRVYGIPKEPGKPEKQLGEFVLPVPDNDLFLLLADEPQGHDPLFSVVGMYSIITPDKGDPYHLSYSLVGARSPEGLRFVLSDIE